MFGQRFRVGDGGCCAVCAACLFCSACLAACCCTGGMTAGQGATSNAIALEVVFWRRLCLAFPNPAAHGLLSLISLLRAFCLHVIKRNQAVFMEVSSRRLAIVQHRHPPARGLLSLISSLSAFLLTGIKRNQAVRVRVRGRERDVWQVVWRCFMHTPHDRVSHLLRHEALATDCRSSRGFSWSLASQVRTVFFFSSQWG